MGQTICHIRCPSEQPLEWSTQDPKGGENLKPHKTCGRLTGTNVLVGVFFPEKHTNLSSGGEGAFVTFFLRIVQCEKVLRLIYFIIEQQSFNLMNFEPWCFSPFGSGREHIFDEIKGKNHYIVLRLVVNDHPGPWTFNQEIKERKFNMLSLHL